MEEDSNVIKMVLSSQFANTELTFGGVVAESPSQQALQLLLIALETTLGLAGLFWLLLLDLLLKQVGTFNCSSSNQC